MSLDIMGTQQPYPWVPEKEVKTELHLTDTGTFHFPAL